MLYAKLLDSFPPTAYTLVYVDSMSEAMEKAKTAALIVVDAKLKGDGVTLCRNLRNVPATSKRPIILLIDKKNDHLQSVTNARVMKDDFKTLVKTMRSLYQAETSQDESAPLQSSGSSEFNERRSTDEWLTIKATAQGSETWPPPPPTHTAQQDLVKYVEHFAGYMNALISSLKNPGTQPTSRIESAASQTLEMVEALLDEVQIAMNESLMAKNLDRMKVLSAAKNSIYDKLQLTRSLFSELAEKSAARETQENLEQVARAAENPSRRVPGGFPIAEQKSALTRAAEEKAARSRTSRQLRPPKPSGTHFSLGSAKKTPRADFSTWFWVGLAAVAVTAAFIVISTSSRKDRTVATKKTDNSPPQMVYAHLEHTAAGIVIRPQAKDKEGSRLSFAVTWIINGKIKKDIKTARLLPQYFKTGDKVQVQVIPDDGTSKGEPMNSEVLIVKMRPRTKTGPKPSGTPKAAP